MCNGINERDEDLIIESNEENVVQKSPSKKFKYVSALLDESINQNEKLIRTMDLMDLENEELKNLLSTNLSWIKLNYGKDLPGGEVVALNNKPFTYGYQEMVIGYLHYDTGEGVIVCESENEVLKGVTHYMKKSFPIVEDGE